MRILQVHNRQTATGGVDVVIADERRLLSQRGHEVELWEYSTPEAVKRHTHIGLAVRSVWNIEASNSLVDRVQQFRPDVMHVHTIFPLLSFAPISAVSRMACPDRPAVVITTHLPRYVCPSGNLTRDGQPCDMCVGKTVKWPAVVHRCYHGSVSQSALLTTSLAVGSQARRGVDRWLALTEDGKQLLVDDGVCPSKVSVKPNLIVDLAELRKPDRDRAKPPVKFGFVGRTEPYKGLRTLVESWDRLAPANASLAIAGTGTLRESDFPSSRGVEWLGWIPQRDLAGFLGELDVLVVPSEMAEGDPLTTIEAASMSVPVLTSAGAPRLRTNIPVYQAGWTFETGSVSCLQSELRRVIGLPDTRRESANARRMYDELHSPDAVIESLEAEYHTALESRDERCASSRAVGG